MKVPLHESDLSLQPTPMNPNAAASLGNSVVDLSQGLEGIGEMVQKLDNKRQALKAETLLATQHRQTAQMVATDPDIDSLDKRVEDRTMQDIQNAAQLIQEPEARNNFVSKAQLDTERRNAPLYRTIMARKSQDFKNTLVQANDEDIKDYQTLADPDERKLIKERIAQRTNDAIKDGHVNSTWAKAHVETLLRSADINQVKSDMAINATATYEQIQKGKDGLYPDLTDSTRKQFADRAQKMIAKQGSDDKLIYGIAQNHAESQLVDKMSNNTLTQEDINNASTMGIKGIRPRPDFIKAATQAINDPFPTDSVPDKYNKLINQVQDTDADPLKTKLDILNARGLTPQEKAHLINAHLREDDNGKQSVNNLINQGIKQNKQALLQADKNLKADLADRNSMFRKITDRFRDHAKDDGHLAALQQDYYSKVQNVKDDKERMELAQQILNNDTLKRNPGIATSNPKGTVYIDKTTGAKRRYYPSGFWEPVKTNNE